jgi:uncharacterized protein (DUF488 family)
MNLYTIGFTKKSAHDFFETLVQNGVKRVVDVRLNNVSQLAGFAKKQDLSYFLQRIGGIGYEHVPTLAPTQGMLDRYKKNGGNWESYEREFLALIGERKVETAWAPSMHDADCLLCSEHRPEHCHRRLVAEYLASQDESIRIYHL